MKRGLYRVIDPVRGELARVDWLAGDGAPWLPRSIYESAGFEPPFHQLPTEGEFRRRHRC